MALMVISTGGGLAIFFLWKRQKEINAFEKEESEYAIKVTGHQWILSHIANRNELSRNPESIYPSLQQASAPSVPQVGQRSVGVFIEDKSVWDMQVKK